MIKVENLPLKDAKLFKLKQIGDSRGWFTEFFRQSWLDDEGITNNFIFEYTSFSANISTVRGMHAQKPDSLQAKLVYVLNGSIQDVIIDARQDSPTFGQYCSVTLSVSEPSMIYIPRGFYHGFCTLEPNSYVNYKLDNYYDPAAECGVMWNTPELNIPWKISGPVTMSNRDQGHPTWTDAYKF